MDIKRLWAILLGAAFVFLTAIFISPAPARAGEQYLTMIYNDNVRIILSKEKCPNAGYRAAAQRVDKKYLRGCWSYAENDMVNIKWEGGDFSEFELARFEPTEVE